MHGNAGKSSEEMAVSKLLTRYRNADGEQRLVEGLSSKKWKDFEL